MVRACADDVAIVIYSLPLLIKVQEIWKVTSRIANLHLNVVKMFFLPFGGGVLDIEVSIVTGWLHLFLPEWAALKVTACALYLGIYVGRLAHLQVWNNPVYKWYARAMSYGRSGDSAFTAISVYHRRAVPVLGYVARFYLPPHSLLRKELGVQASLLHFPAGTLRVCDGFHIDKVGAPKFKSIIAYCLASLYRSAISTHDAWRD